MKYITKILLLFLYFTCFSQETSVPCELQQKFNHISEQIQLAHGSQYLSVHNTQYDKDLLLLSLVEPIHTYILTHARDFLPQFSALYDELIEKLLNYDGLEITQYQEILQHALLIKLNEALAQYHDETFMQHVIHIAKLLNVQDQLVPTQAASSSNNHQESEIAEEVVQPSVELHHKKSTASYPRYRIQELLDAHKWTVTKLAEKTGLNMPYIGAIKNGNRSCRNAALQKIAAAFDIEVRDLFINPNEYELNSPVVILRIQELLDVHQWTAIQLAEKTGLSRWYIRAIKNGRQRGSKATLQKIAAALHVEVRDLFINPNDYPPELDLLSTQNFLLQESVVHDDAQQAPASSSSIDDPDRHIGPATKRARQR